MRDEWKRTRVGASFRDEPWLWWKLFSESFRQGFSFRRVLSGNLIGETLGQMVIPAYESLLAKKCQENVTVAATQVLLALKCYQLKQGTLPDTLAALVPEFLSQLPVDDFDGNPLRYLKDKKLIYSVGKNLRDVARFQDVARCQGWSILCRHPPIPPLLQQHAPEGRERGDIG